MHLLLDVDHTRVHLRSEGELRKRSPKWLAFYAILARAAAGAVRDRDAYVTVETLQRYRAWADIKPMSARKEIARHLRELSVHQCADVVAHRGATLAWRLREGVEIHQHPSASALAAWIDAQEIEAQDLNWLPQFFVLLDASTDLQKGRLAQAQAAAGEAYERLRERRSPLPLGQWAALLFARAAQRTDAPLAVIDGLLDDLGTPGNAVEQAVWTRVVALKVMRDRFVESARDRDHLDQLAHVLEQRGDIAALAAVLNVRGLVRRRSRDHAAARRDHAEAAILFGIVGDLASLQGALFNLAVCRSDECAARGEPPGDEVFSLLDASLRVCADFSLGRDSLQAEIAGVRWSLARNDPVRARAYLQAAHRVLSAMQPVPKYDRACLARARAELAVHAHREDEARASFREAIRVFEEIGAVGEVATIQQRLAAVMPGASGARREP